MNMTRQLSSTEAEAYLNGTLTFSLYLKEKTTLLYYKDQLVNAI
jgi:hypothetical protein